VFVTTECGEGTEKEEKGRRDFNYREPSAASGVPPSAATKGFPGFTFRIQPQR